ncbi:MAG TPA: TetR/AcrR family transcriptional regulator [Candidatus Binatia bacterium]|nr:TetR/AcrR family transcriptional regulator [Candidatus Binatia bacterium]
MARTLDVAVHTVRRDTFVEAAQRLIVTEGYEQMSVQDVLDEVDASRGAFYHYFDSKGALLDAVVERMVDQATTRVEPIATDASLTATGRLSGIFTGIADWKGEQADLILGILDAWLADENAIVREKVRRHILERLTPLLTTILRDGRASGEFSLTAPEETARVVISLVLGANETASRLFVARQAGTVEVDEVIRVLAAFAEALERIVGAEPGSLPIADEALIRRWYT